jgi:hypothetical protein
VGAGKSRRELAAAVAAGAVTNNDVTELGAVLIGEAGP